MTWRQIERALVDFLRSRGVGLTADGGEAEVEVVGRNAEIEGVWLSDLAQYLERELSL